MSCPYTTIHGLLQVDLRKVMDPGSGVKIDFNETSGMNSQEVENPMMS